MASIRYSFGVDSLIGSIAGTTYQRSRSGYTVRSKPRPRNPRSLRQSNFRQSVAFLSQAWRGLSDAQRTSWDSVAPNWPAVDRHGDPVVLSGYDVFMKANIGMNIATSSINSSGVNPTALWVPILPSMTISVGAGTSVWSWAAGPVGADCIAFLRASRMMSAGRAYQATGFQYIAEAPATTASGVNVQSELTTLLGQAPVLGARIWFEMIVFSTLSGNASAPVPFTCIVVA